MNFHRSGWLRRYLDYRTAVPIADRLPTSGVKILGDAGQHHELDEAIYYFLQPTGLLYGFPVGLPFEKQTYPGSHTMDSMDRVHLIFLESLFACMVADRHYLLQGLSDETDHFPPTVQLAAEFFTHPGGTSAARGLAALPHLTWLRKGDLTKRFEPALRRKIGLGTEFLQLPGHYYNSFLFLDLYYCMSWQRRMLVEPEAADDHIRDLAERELADRELLIRLMIAAASVSGGIVPAERRLIDWFIRSSGLPRPQIGSLRRALKHGQTLQGLDIPDMPWLIRRFMLEATLMTMLVDRVLSRSEERFLERVVEQLQLWQEELDQSKVALEVFILHRESELRIFQDRPALLNAGGHVREQATRILHRNLQHIVQEIRETHELYNLMMKSTHLPLTSEEKAKVREQLLDILKTIPALAIFALPGGGLILPILIRLLPFNLLPSSFEDE